MDLRALRSCFGRFATGVTVVTTRGLDGRPVGLTANSFASVSLEPPLLSWNLSKRSPSRAVFEQAEWFAINVLASDQLALSQRFATPAEDKFAGLMWREGIGGVPLLEGCIARFECSAAHRFEAGDHVIFVGQIVEFGHHEDADPLLFFAGRYGVASPHPETA